MISSILRASLVAVALCALAGTAAAEGQWTSAETQAGGVPFWMWHQFKAYKKKPHYRALACADAGRQGVYCFSDHAYPTAEYAAEHVMERCRAEAQRHSVFAPCRLRFIGDIDVYGLTGQKLDAAIRVYQQNPNATNKDLRTAAADQLIRRWLRQAACASK